MCWSSRELRELRRQEETQEQEELRPRLVEREPDFEERETVEQEEERELVRA